MAEVPENDKPTPTPVAPAAKGKTLDAAAKMTAQEVVAKMRKELAEATRQLAAEKNFGPGKPGRIEYQIPKFPSAWRLPDLKTCNAKGKTIYKQGHVYELTYDEIEDLTGRYGTRIQFEEIARHGNREHDVNVSDNGGFLF